jgi:hypothetical protein
MTSFSDNHASNTDKIKIVNIIQPNTGTSSNSEGNGDDSIGGEAIDLM